MPIPGEIAEYVNSVSKYAVLKKNNLVRIRNLRRLNNEIIAWSKKDAHDPRIEINRKTARGVREQVIVGNLRLVINLSKKFTNRGLPQEDIIAFGNIGLCRAVDAFNPWYKTENGKSIQFSTYASRLIMTNMHVAVSDQHITLGRSVNQQIGTLVNAERKLHIKGNCNPSDSDISEEMNISGPPSSKGSWGLATIQRLKEARKQQHICSIDPIIYDSEAKDLTYEYHQEWLEHESEKSLLDKIAKIIDQIPYREAEILRHRYGLDDYKPLTLREVGELFHVTKERIRQIEAKAIDRIRCRLMNGNGEHIQI